MRDVFFLTGCIWSSFMFFFAPDQAWVCSMIDPGKICRSKSLGGAELLGAF